MVALKEPPDFLLKLIVFAGLFFFLIFALPVKVAAVLDSLLRWVGWNASCGLR